MQFIPASLTLRILAYGLDYIIIGLLTVPVILICNFIDMTFAHSAFGVFMMLFLLVGLYLFYIPLMETFNNGQTLGKLIFKIRTVRTDGSPASGVHCLQRYLLLPFDLWFTMGLGGWLSAMASSRRQRLGDLVADTMVVEYAISNKRYAAMAGDYYRVYTDKEQAYYREIGYPQFGNSDYMTPTALATQHRHIESMLADLRTHKGSPSLISWFEHVLGMVHLHMFSHTSYTFGDMTRFTLRSIPRAVYESRRYIYASIIIVIISYIVGIYSQTVDHDFFRHVFGPSYTETTINNIDKGDPMGIYKEHEPMMMMFSIFWNNLQVTMRLYISGIFTLVGPLYMLTENFISFAAFDTFFAQHGYLGEALISPNEHGVLELSSIIIAGGAALRLGSGWLFPGRLTRLQALARGARHSMLILLSTIPMLLVAAFIESFVTRHTEWPVAVKLSIIIVSLMIIIGYYVMLPIIARRH